MARQHLSRGDPLQGAHSPGPAGQGPLAAPSSTRCGATVWSCCSAAFGRAPSSRLILLMTRGRPGPAPLRAQRVALPDLRGPVMSWDIQTRTAYAPRRASRCARSRRRRRRPRKPRSAPPRRRPPRPRRPRASADAGQALPLALRRGRRRGHVARDADGQGAQGQADGAGGADGRAQVGSRRAADGPGGADVRSAEDAAATARARARAARSSTSPTSTRRKPCARARRAATRK